jgi:DNA polymerase III delta' subunit
MHNAATRGQPRALTEAAAMVAGRPPHAVMLVGSGSIGKTTLALDLAAGLLCLDPDPSARPCRACRGCRQVASGNHPDLHRLAPEGPGGQIRIGRPADPEPGTVRHLIGELALLPVEGGARVVIVEKAHRLNEDAQNALLKMLEEPPDGVTIVLCVDDEECLLPTVRSRCVRLRLSPVAGREIERWLVETEDVEAPRAARLARLADGRPGLALAYARSADAERLRGEIARGILDLLTARRQARLAAVREMLKSAAALVAALDATTAGVAAVGAGLAEAGLANGSGRGRARGRASGGASRSGGRGRRNGAETRAADEAAAEAAEAAPDDPAEPRLAAADRRAAAGVLLDVWASVGRDLAAAQAGAMGQLREIALLDEVRVLGPAVRPAAIAGFLRRLAAVDAQLDENANAELALDVLALSWPQVERAVASRASERHP